MKPNRKEGGVYMPIAVVSGADRNIGLEIVKQFLQRGWKVFAGRYLMELPLLEELQEKYPQQLTLVPLDVSDEESVDAAAGSGAGQAHLLHDHRAEQQQRGARLRRLSRTRLQSAAEHGDEPAVQRPAPERITARIPQPRRKGRANTQWNTLPATAATSRNPTSIPTRTALRCATG